MGCAQVAFGVVGVVIGPVGDGGSGYGGFKEVGPLQDGLGGEVTAEGPAPAADAVEVEFGVLGAELLQGFDLIF